MPEKLTRSGLTESMVEGKFEDIFGGEELGRFKILIEQKAQDAGGFVIGFHTPGGGGFWQLYKFGGGQPSLINGKFPISEDLPVAYEGYPVVFLWRGDIEDK